MPGTLAAGQVNIGSALVDFWRSVLLFVPKAVAFIVILVVGWLIARAVLKIVEAALERVGFDRAVERGGLKRALERTKYDASDILARLAYYFVLLFTLQFAFGVWGPNAISNLISGVVAWLPRAFVAIVIVVIAFAIANAIRDIVSGALGGMSYGRVLADLAAIFVIALGVIAALNQVGIATTVTMPVLIAVLATVAGILIVGIGGGLIRPMQTRWEGWLNRIAEESRAVRERQQGAEAGRADMQRQMAERAGAERTDQTGAERTQAMTGGRGTYQSGNMGGDQTQQFRS